RGLPVTAVPGPDLVQAALNGVGGVPVGVVRGCYRGAPGAVGLGGDAVLAVEEPGHLATHGRRALEPAERLVVGEGRGVTVGSPRIGQRGERERVIGIRQGGGPGEGAGRGPSSGSRHDLL